ncbi:MAG: hypothetical protein PHE89_05440 [Alphaproteobacteria bacterium]|nr:hypothetical protein [Alphaproteobacteria bacterium]
MKKSYFIFLGAFLLFCSSFTLTYNAFAGVYFITKPQGNNDGVSNKPCQLMGYIYDSSNCGEGKSLSQKCPNGNSYKFCNCNTSSYPYTTLNCTEKGKVLGGNICANIYYEKCECEEKYQHDLSNCPFPKVLSGEICGEKSETCSCPSEYNQICTGNLEGVGTSCDDKYTACKCKSNFTKCDNGGATGANSCIDSQGTKYDSCQAEITYVSCHDVVVPNHRTDPIVERYNIHKGYAVGRYDAPEGVDEMCFIYYYDQTHRLHSCDKTTCVFEALNDFSLIDSQNNIIKTIHKGTKTAKFPIKSGDDRLYYMSLSPDLKDGDYDTTPGYLDEDDILMAQRNAWVDSSAKITIFINDQKRRKIVDEGVFILDESEISENADLWTLPVNSGFYLDAKGFQLYGTIIMRNKAKVYGNAEIHPEYLGTIELRDNAQVFEDAVIRQAGSAEDKLQISENVKIYGKAKITADNAQISGKAKIYGNAYVFGSNELIIKDNAIIKGEVVSGATINGKNTRVEISGNAKICGNVRAGLADRPLKISGDAVVAGKSAFVEGQAQISGNAIIAGTARIGGETIVSGTAKICSGVYTSGTYTSGSYGCEGYTEADFICE